MKSLKIAVLSMVVVAGAANARSILRPDLRGDVAPVLSQIDVVSVDSRGEIVKTARTHPYTTFTIAIPAKVSEKSACTKFVGQQTNKEASGLQVIRAIGASDATNDVCIEIFPAPISTKLTVKLTVLTGGFVPAAPVQRQIVQIMPLGLHEITLDLGNNSVSVRPLRIRPRF